MKWLKKHYYLILLVTVGIVYLSRVDQWKVYAEAAEQVKEFCLGIGRGAAGAPGGSGAGQDGAIGGSGQNGTAGGQGQDGAMGGSGQDGTAGGQGQDGAMGGAGQDGTAGGAGQDGAMGGSGQDGMAGGAGQDGAMGGSGQDGTAGGAGQDGVMGGSGQDGMIGGQGQDGTTGGQDQNGTSGDTGESGQTPEPVFMTVEDDYFSDAVFIGDSRTVGMYEYGGLEEISTFYASTGLTIYKIFDAEIVEVPGQKKKITIEEALQENSFAKIYLMIGINEMGTGTVETFTEKYGEVVEHLRELQPEAVIYIQGIIKVTTERSNQGDYINNEGIVARNQELEKLADNRRIFYLDVNPLICDETGGLIDSYTFDGVHLKAKYIQIWKDFLKENAVQINTISQ